MKYLKLNNLLIAFLTISSTVTFAQYEHDVEAKTYKQAFGGRIGYSNIDFMGVSFENFSHAKVLLK